MSGPTNYRYTALRSGGERCRGTVRAASKREAAKSLASMGLTALSVRVAASEGLALRLSGRVETTHLAALTRELSVLLQARIPLDRGLMGMAENERSAVLREMLRDIAQQIGAGASIGDAMDRHRAHLGDVYVETMRAAEHTGSLDQVAEHLADMLERRIEATQQLRRALAYPLIVAGVVSAALAVILLLVVPRFSTIFAGSGVQLPASTRAVQWLGAVAHAHWLPIGIAAAVAGVAMAAAWRTARGRRLYELAFLRLPVVGRIMVATTAAQFGRVLQISLASGMDLIDSVEVAARATGRPVFVDECGRMTERLRGGERLSEVMGGSRYIPGFARRLLGSGTDADDLASASGVIARHYERESGHLTRTINTVIEPLMTVALAGIVLLVAMSVFLPMWQMVGANR